MIGGMDCQPSYVGRSPVEIGEDEGRDPYDVLFDAIKTLDNKPVLNNFCCGSEYNEEETVSEVDFVYSYLAQFKKDVKYYLGKDYEVDERYWKILTAYKAFLTENKGFTELKTTDDIKLPKEVKTLTADSVKPVIEKIEQVVESGQLTELYDLYGEVL